MEITKVEIRPLEDEGALKAFGSVVFDDVFIVHGIKVIEGSDGPFVVMPSRRVADGEYVDIAHPIDRGFHRRLEDAVLARFWEMVR
ncbi:MAG: SpoVG family protein [Salinibacter sp.]